MYFYLATLDENRFDFGKHDAFTRCALMAQLISVVALSDAVTTVSFSSFTKRTPMKHSRNGKFSSFRRFSDAANFTQLEIIATRAFLCAHYTLSDAVRRLIFFSFGPLYREVHASIKIP